MPTPIPSRPVTVGAMEAPRTMAGENSDKLSYEIFSILESKFLFGYGDGHDLWLAIPPPPPLPGAWAEGEAARSRRGRVCVLCVDSGDGGVGGAVAAGKVLARLEAALQRSSGDPAARVADFFDVAAGSGAGGVFAAMLFAAGRRGGGRPLFRADDTWRLVADHAELLFPRTKAAKSAALTCGLRRPRMKRKARAREAAAAMEKVLKEAFGEELTLRDTLKPVLVPCYDMRAAAPLVFSRADAVESASFDFRLWEVCRATWAEPGLGAAPAVVRSVDGATTVAAAGGALAMSNPAAAAITHVLHNKEEFPFVRGVEDIVVVSIGCSGVGNGIGIGMDDGLRGAREWGPADWARPMARIAANGAADLVDYSVAMAFGHWRSTNYVRIQASGLCTAARCAGDSECDPGPSNLKAMAVAAEEMLRQKNVESVLFSGRRIGEQTNAERIDWIAGELVLEHRTRSCRIAPTVAFKQPPPRPS